MLRHFRIFFIYSGVGDGRVLRFEVDRGIVCPHRYAAELSRMHDACTQPALPEIPSLRLDDAKDLQTHFRNLAVARLARRDVDAVVDLLVVCTTVLLADT